MDIVGKVNINHPNGARKVINLSRQFLFSDKNKPLDKLQIHNKIISLVQDELKKSFINKEDFNYTFYDEK
jgi:hypothetical protein